MAGRPLTKKMIWDAAKSLMEPPKPDVVLLPFRVVESLYWGEVFEGTVKGTGFVLEMATTEGVV